MKRMREIFFTVLVFASLPLIGQEQYGLEDLVTIALRENYQLQIIRKHQQMVENRNTLGNAGFLPSVSVASESSWDIQSSESNLFTGQIRSGDNARSSRFNAMVEVNWMVFDGFSMYARRDRLGHLAKLGELETKYLLEQTIADLAKSYYLLIKEHRLLESYRKLQEVSAFRFQLEERKRSIGSGNALLYHQALVDYNTDSAIVIHQEMNITDHRIRINRVINLNPESPWHTESRGIELEGLSMSEEVLEMAYANNKELERAKLEELLAEADYRVEIGERYPHVSVFGNYAYSHQRSDLGIVESSHSRGAHFGFRVRFNLYDGGRQNIRVKNMRLEQQRADLYHQDTRALIESDLIRLFNRYDGYLQQYRLLQRSVEAAELSMRIAREQLQTGAINGYEFRLTQLAALKIENQIIELQYAIKVIEIDIHRLTGVLMDKIFSN